MNAMFRRIADRPSTPRPAAPSTPRFSRERARDFGVGYGHSSGYATTRHYASNWGQPRFRFA